MLTDNITDFSVEPYLCEADLDFWWLKLSVFHKFVKHFESPDAVKEGLDDVRQVPFALEFDTTSAAGANAMRLFLERSGLTTRRI